MTEPFSSARGAEVEIDGEWLVSFAGCDSLGLARHPEVIEAAREALGRCGVSAGASRTTTGTWDEHVRLEAALADYMGEPDAVVFPAGWLACQSLLQALTGRSRGVLMDARAHPGVRDAVTLAGVPVQEYARFDADDAERLTAELVGGRPIIATCSVDLATGGLAPLGKLARCAADVAGTLVVDDAHGVGVLSANGRGAAELLGAIGQHVHVAGTLSKAFGTQGGFVATSRELCAAIRERAPAYGGATPLPPAIAAAARRAVELASEGTLRATLVERCVDLRTRLAELGLAVPAETVPWMAVHAETEAELRRIEAALRAEGLLVPYVRYHGAPPQGYLRVAVSAAHDASHIERLATALRTTLPSA